MKSEDIKKLIPQREPFIMVDGFEQVADNSAVTTLSICRDNYFMLPDGTLSETGLIEHLAQSCSALAGAQTLRHATPSGEGWDATPPVGLIGEVKHFTCHRRPHQGERLTSTVTFSLTFGTVTLATGQTFVDEEAIAAIQLKIFMP